MSLAKRHNHIWHKVKNKFVQLCSLVVVSLNKTIAAKGYPHTPCSDHARPRRSDWPKLLSFYYGDWPTSIGNCYLMSFGFFSSRQSGRQLDPNSFIPPTVILYYFHKIYLAFKAVFIWLFTWTLWQRRDRWLLAVILIKPGGVLYLDYTITYSYTRPELDVRLSWWLQLKYHLIKYIFIYMTILYD